MTHLRRSRGWLWLLLAAALFMRAVVPQGFMAERDDRGAIAVKVCGSGHLLRIPLGEDEAPDDDRAQQPCAFAGLGMSALPPPSPGEPLVLRAPQTAFAIPRADTQRRPSLLFHPPARGPPRAA